MPNHMHLIWELLEFNGAVYPHKTLLNSTSIQFLNLLKSENSHELENYRDESQINPPQFWQDETLFIQINNLENFSQKLDYMHNNPIQEKWKLANKPIEYLYSSAFFYESGLDKFGILTNIEDRFKNSTFL